MESMKPVALARARDLQPSDFPAQSVKAGGRAEDHHQKIEQLAYSLWQDRGSPIGSPEQDWFEAEKQLGKAETGFAAAAG
jgi:hypothetical protein